jgi:hypothetical protein
MHAVRFFKILSRMLTTGLILSLTATSAFAGTVGKIAGTILDSDSGDPIIGAAVQIEGTSIGAAADINGRFFILNVPPGLISIRCSAIGFAARTIQGIQVISDQTSTVDFALVPESLLGEEVIVVAERELIEPDRTFTTSTVAASEIAALPVTSLSQVVEIQAGVVDGHFRGGRKGEEIYLLDGVSITDVYDNAQGTQVDDNVVEELQVISGTFNAEYGQAMSGVVSIVTKDGGSDYHGTFTSEFGDYLSTDKDIFLNINDVSPTAIQDYTGSLSGPVPFVKDLTFFGSLRYLSDSGWLYGQRRFRPTWEFEDFILSSPADADSTDIYGDNSFVEMNRNFEAFGLGKFSYPLSPTIKLNYSSVFSTRAYKDYSHDRKFVPDADLRRFKNGRTNTLKWNQTLSSRVFYEVAASNTFAEYHHYTFEDSLDSRYVDPAWADQDGSNFLDFAGTNTSRFRRWTNTNQLLGQMSWQVDNLNLLKAGFDFKLHELWYEDINLTDPNSQSDSSSVNFFWTPHILDVSTLSHDFYRNNPNEIGLYLQDKFELPSLIINAGVRFDYFDPDGQIPADPKDPNIYDPLLEWRVINGDSVNVLAQTPDQRRSYWYKDASAKVRISPRIGIAYPMTDKGVFHFSYGHFVQRPTFERMYANPEWELEPGVGLNTVMGNPDLNMEETVTYEFGLQQQLTESVALNSTIFFRDIRNLVATDRIVETYSSGKKYSQYVNRAFGEVKGITLSFDKRFDYSFSAFVDYTYQVAEGNASDPQASYNALKGNSPREPETQLVPLDWDRRHTLNASLTYSVPGASGWGATLLGKYGSGKPYSPDDRGIRTGFENDGRQPDFYNFDLSAFKNFPIGNGRQKIALLLTVLNVADTRNEDRVYNDTGRAGSTLQDDNLPEYPFVSTLKETFSDPSYYSRPRMVKAGVRYEF